LLIALLLAVPHQSSKTTSSKDELVQLVLETKELCCIFLGLYGGEGSALADGGGAENKKTVYEIFQSKYFLHR